MEEEEKRKRQWLEMDTWTGLQVLFFLDGQVNQENYIALCNDVAFWGEKIRNDHVDPDYDEMQGKVVVFISFHNKAHDLTNAVYAGALTPVGKDDRTVHGAERFFKEKHPILSNLFRPKEVVEWANKKRALYPAFPFTLDDLKLLEEEQAGKEADTGKTDEAPSTGLYKIVGAMALALAERVNTYKLGERPNASQIADAVSKILDALPKSDRRGASKTNIREAISKGLAELAK
jgi:hypothetical protein